MSRPAFTVLLPHFGCERFLRESVASVLNQRGVAVTLLVADDASADDQWLRELAPFRDDPRLRLFQADRNVGPYRLKNRLLEFVRTPLMALQDADDRSHPDRLRRQAHALRRADIVGCGFRRIDESGKPGRAKRFPRNSNRCRARGGGWLLLHPTTAAWSSAVTKLGGFDGTTRIAADTDFVFRAVRCLRVRTLRRLLYDHREHPHSLSRAPATGQGSALREAYVRELQRREAARDEAPDPVTLAALLRAPSNDVSFALREVHAVGEAVSLPAVGPA